jgi:hypothetical protein
LAPDVPDEPLVPDEPSPPAAPFKFVDQEVNVPVPVIAETLRVKEPVDGSYDTTCPLK